MAGQSETKHTRGVLSISDYLYDTIVVETEHGHDEIARSCFINRHDSAKANLAEERANAARIVLTWNCHDELVAALTKARAAFRKYEMDVDADAPSHHREMMAEIEAALAKATSPTP